MTEQIKIAPKGKKWVDGVWINAPEGFSCDKANVVFDLDGYLFPFTPEGMHIVDWRTIDEH